MAANSRLSTSGVIGSAISLIDSADFDALTVSAVAERLCVAPSALYTYCDGLDGLRHLVAIAATNNLTTDVRNAAIGTSGGHALRAMGSAYRNFALNCPGQFASTLRPPPAANNELVSANRSLLNVFVLVYAAMGFKNKESTLAARSTRSAIHGFLALEHTTGTHDDHPEQYQHLLDTLQRGLAD